MIPPLSIPSFPVAPCLSPSPSLHPSLARASLPAAAASCALQIRSCAFAFARETRAKGVRGRHAESCRRQNRDTSVSSQLTPFHCVSQALERLINGISVIVCLCVSVCMFICFCMCACLCLPDFFFFPLAATSKNSWATSRINKMTSVHLLGAPESN